MPIKSTSFGLLTVCPERKCYKCNFNARNATCGLAGRQRKVGKGELHPLVKGFQPVLDNVQRQDWEWTLGIFKVRLASRPEGVGGGASTSFAEWGSAPHNPSCLKSPVSNPQLATGHLLLTWVRVPSQPLSWASRDAKKQNLHTPWSGVGETCKNGLMGSSPSEQLRSVHLPFRCSQHLLWEELWVKGFQKSFLGK